ncbi:hypothetical protein [Anthocerotibacter panamensis]|uniref:hypothetical protein n=1 Tax=Anthocerotibacter panamensis TaxID=2857077 RepID=UPI001C40648C|nr:hypothetical protein [Anthocerotibacter panamensis]
MTHLVNIHQAIKAEFTCHYLIDELPEEWDSLFFQIDLPKMARSSAIRLQREVGNSYVDDLIKALQDMNSDPSHPLVNAISESSLFNWADEPNDWHVFQILLNLITQDLKQYIL